MSSASYLLSARRRLGSLRSMCYEEALRVLEPILIIRYGDKMPCEREDISVYFENINLKNLRNGRKRIS